MTTWGVGEHVEAFLRLDSISQPKMRSTKTDNFVHVT